MGNLLIIIPAYNEERAILKVIRGVKTHIPDTDILVIDDGSRDKTAVCAKEAGVEVVRLPHNLGYGAALQTGYKYAIIHGYDIILQMDADGQHDSRSIKNLLGPIREGKADIVIGSRFLKRRSYRAHIIRRIGMIIFGHIASLILRQKLTDPTSGFQAMKKSVVKFYATDVFPADFPDADVIIMTRLAGFRIKEVPVVMYVDRTGSSMHRGLTDLYYVFKMFLSITVTLLRKKVDITRRS